jgi:hypothetical protein
VIFHGDGTPVNIASPARKAENLSVLVYGLGQTSPAGITGAAAQPGYMVTDVLGVPRVVISLAPFGNASPTIPRGGYAPQPGDVPAAIVSAGLQTGKVGVYQVTFAVPESVDPFAECGGSVRSNYLLNVTTSQGTERIPVCVAK